MKSATMVYQLSYSDARSYGFAVLFVFGNIIFPQLCHLVPQGGFIFLPIYFFTLIAAYKYGLFVGLMVAVFSPLVNHLLFGMPPLGVLPILLIKGILLALSASLVAWRTRVVSLWALLAVVATYQLLGTFAEWVLTGSLAVALQDFRIGYPGMLLQVVGGFVVLKYILRK